MDRKTISIAAVAVNLLMTPAMAAEPTLDECKGAFVEWVFGEPGIVSGFLRTRDELAIALNEHVLDGMSEKDAEHVSQCLEVLMDDDRQAVPLDPEDWPQAPGEET